MTNVKQFWDRFVDLVGHANVVPIANAGPDTESDLPAGVVGKVPSVFDREGKIVGFKNWQNQRVTASQFARFRDDGRYGFGVITGQPVPAGGVAVCIDADTEDARLQDVVNDIVCAALGRDIIPQRVRGNSNRRAYVLRVMTEEPIFKTVLKLAPNADTGKQEAIEVLGLGQQFAAWGIHPSGAKIEWLTGAANDFTAEPAIPSWEDLTLSAEQFAQLREQLREQLPVISTTTAKQRQRQAANDETANDDAVAIFLDENGYTLDIGSEGQRYIRSPFGDEYSTPQDENDTSVCYFLPGTHGYEVGHFVSMHASDAERQDQDWLNAVGFIADQFETLPALIEDSPRSVPYMGISGKGCLLNDKGYTGNRRADKIRAEISQALNLPLRYIPPMVTPRYNNKGELISFAPLNHSLNLRFAVERLGLMLMLNMMTGQIELFKADGTPATNSDAQTSSMIVNSLSECGIPLDTESKHFDALAAINSYHPIYRLFQGREWDGVERVQKVLACVHSKYPTFAQRMIKKTLIAAIAALENGFIEMKTVPVLYSRENNFYKSAFIKRLFSILPNSFMEGLSVDPRSKDSIRPAVCCWGAELGELDSMSKVESGLLKAWIPAAKDKWRVEHKSFYFEKPRQTVYMGTVNKDDFIKDETLASRLPVISLTAPIDIDEVNRLLGWEHDGNAPRLVDAEQLTQFWLEVREMYRAGDIYGVSAEELAEGLEHSKEFVPKSAFEEIASAYIDEFKEADGYKLEWLRLPEICRVMNINPEKSREMGIALKKLADEGVIQRKTPKNARLYEIPVMSDTF